MKTFYFFGSQMARMLLLATIVLSFTETSHARDLQGRLGVGYNAQFSNRSASNGVPALSFRYALTKEFGIQGIFGVATSSPGNTVAALKLFKNVFYETNLNFYFLLGGGVVTAQGTSGAEFLGGVGSEFFIPGLESLSFCFELGASLTNLTGSFVLKTMGASFLEAGMHFYF